MDMLKNAVVKIVQDLLIKKYPHTQQPPSMYAMVTEVKPKKNYKAVALDIINSAKQSYYDMFCRLKNELEQNWI